MPSILITGVSTGIGRACANLYAGAGWDKSGDFPTSAAWEAYVDQTARRLASPVAVTVTPK